MTAKQELFCAAFIKNKYCAKAAYLEVYGGTEINAEKSGSRLLKNPEVKARINELTK